MLRGWLEIGISPVWVLLAAGLLLLRLTWNRRAGGLVPLVVCLFALAPLAIFGWLGGEVARRSFRRPTKIRRALAMAGLSHLLDGRTLQVGRFALRSTNAVVPVTLSKAGEMPIRLVLKKFLSWGSVLAWGARSFGTQCEYPPDLTCAARMKRELHALQRLHDLGIPVPQVLGFNTDVHILATACVDGSDLCNALSVDATLVAALGKMLAVCHRHDITLGDPHPRNMLLDRKGRIVPLDFEFARIGESATWQAKGFDLALAVAFLGSEILQDHFFSAYGKLSSKLLFSLQAAKLQLLRFWPLVDWEAQWWRRQEAASQPYDPQLSTSGVHEPSESEN